MNYEINCGVADFNNVEIKKVINRKKGNRQKKK